MAQRPRRQPPHIVLITSDQQRTDTIRAYGGASAARSPGLDRMALSGVRFSRAYVAAPVCIPSRASLLTGLHANVHRCGFSKGPSGCTFANRGMCPQASCQWRPEHTLPRQLSAHGYRTIFLRTGKTHWHSHGQRAAYSHVDKLFSEVLPVKPSPCAHHNSTFVTGCRHADTNEGLMTTALLTRLAKPTSNPTFAWLSLVPPHELLRVPVGIEWPKASELPPLIARAADEAVPRVCRHMLGKPNSVQQRNDYRRAYYAFTYSGVDIQVGRVLEFIRSRRRQRSTLVAFTSDRIGIWCSTQTNSLSLPLRLSRGRHRDRRQPELGPWVRRRRHPKL